MSGLRHELMILRTTSEKIHAILDLRMSVQLGGLGVVVEPWCSASAVTVATCHRAFDATATVPPSNECCED
jgi:hypothetical protein